jgi:hypothetical protein
MKTADTIYWKRSSYMQNKHQLGAKQTAQYWLLPEVASAQNTIRQHNLPRHYLNVSSPVFTAIRIMILSLCSGDTNRTIILRWVTGTLNKLFNRAHRTQYQY